MTAEDWLAYPPEEAVEDYADGAEDDFSAPLQEAQQHDAYQQVMPGVSPGAIIEAMEDPRVFAEVARGDLYVQMARMRALLPSLAASHQLEYTKFLAKLGKVDAPEPDQGAALSRVPMIQIDLGGGNRLSIGAASQEKDITPGVEG